MKLDAPWLKEPPLSALLAALDRDGEEARVVGGAVRNALMGLPHGDIDVATTALPQEVTRRAVAAGFKAVPTGFDPGTVTVVIESRPFEVTTLREDVVTLGAMPRCGSGATGTRRRAATSMNALTLAPGTVHDPVGGLVISSAAACASSATPQRAFAKTICASCASSASTPVTAKARPTRPDCMP